MDRWRYLEFMQASKSRVGTAQADGKLKAVRELCMERKLFNFSHRFEPIPAQIDKSFFKTVLNMIFLDPPSYTHTPL